MNLFKHPKVLATTYASVATAFIFSAVDAHAVPRYLPSSSDLQQAMDETLAASQSQSVTESDDSLHFQVDNFGAEVVCINGWEDASAEYNAQFNNNAAYYYCTGPMSLTVDDTGALPISLNAEHLLISSNGQFFGKLIQVPSVPFDGADEITSNLSGSHVAFAFAKGAIIEEYGSLNVGLPDDRLMAFFDINLTNGGSLQLTDSLKASTGDSASLKVVLDWKDPLYYFNTNAFTKGSMGQAPAQLTGQGISWHGRLGFDANYPVWDGSDWVGAANEDGILVKADDFDDIKFTQDGHIVVEGKIKLGSYPVSVSGLFNLDVDASDDGYNGKGDILNQLEKSIIEIASDTSLAGNGTLAADLGSVANIKFSLNVGKATTNFNSAQKRLSFWGESVDFTEGGLIGDFLDGITVPDIVTYGMIDINNNKIDRFEQSFRADINHNGFKLKGSERIVANVPGEKDGLTITGEFAYQGADIPFTLEVTESSCKTTIDPSAVANIGGQSLGKMGVDICSIIGDALVQLTGYVTVAGKEVYMAGKTAWNQANTLYSNSGQTFNTANGYITSSGVELKNTGMTVKNAVLKYGNKAKSFSVNNLSATASGFANKVSSWLTNSNLNTGKIYLGGTGKVAWQYFRIYGESDYRGKINGKTMTAPHSTNLKVEYCAKFLGKKDCKKDTIAPITGNLDANGCFKTPSMSKHVKILGKKIGFKIPSQKMCMF